MKIGEHLRALRQERDLTLADVAGRIGVGIPYVCDIELGRRPCSPHTAARFADALDVPRERLVQVVMETLVSSLGLEVVVRKRLRGVP